MVCPPVRPWVLAPAASTFARIILLAIGFVTIQHTDWRREPPRTFPKEEKWPQRKPRDRGETAIVVSNHVSWLDILVMQCFYAAAFVTRVETRRTPAIGGICDALPCIYVDRQGGGKTIASGARGRNWSGRAPEGATDEGGVTTTNKVVARVHSKTRDPRAALRPLCAFVEVRPYAT